MVVTISQSLTAGVDDLRLIQIGMMLDLIATSGGREPERFVDERDG